MSNSKNIVFEGWLTKSPPSKRIWRTKWRRRWFALRQSGELPGQYLLDYYADRNCRRLKGTINLDLCEQVDAGLHMERGNGGSDTKIRGSVFTIQTQSRVYHLEADSESDMEKWVDAICRVCGLRATDNGSNIPDTCQNSIGTMTTESGPMEPRENKSLYIPISECVTGARAQDARAFTFDRSHILASCGTVEKRIDISTQTPTPHFKVNVTEFSENESNVSDEDCKSLNTSDNNIRDWSVAKSFTKLTMSPKRNGDSEDGPPVPPRPPKTFAMTKDLLNKEHHGYQGPRIQEPVELQDIAQALPTPRTPRAGPPSPLRAHCSRYTDDEEEYSPGLQSMQYCNLPMSLPPAVDRARKPRPSSHSMGPSLANSNAAQFIPQPVRYEPKDTLQYLDLDLHTTEPPSFKPQDIPRKKFQPSVGKSLPDEDSESAYKTVDFLKTEAFNITRQDAEASRNYQH